MWCPQFNSPPTPSATRPAGAIIAQMTARREVRLLRTMDGAYELCTFNPTKPGSAWGDRLVLSSKLQLGSRTAPEIIAAIHQICELVKQHGLPTEAADAAA
jgi:hypothetical protein